MNPNVKGIINFSSILNVEESIEEEEVLLHRSGKIGLRLIEAARCFGDQCVLWGPMLDGQTPLTKGPFLNQFSFKEAPGARAPFLLSPSLEANLSNGPALDLVVEQIVEEEPKKSKRKAKGATVEGSPPAKKRKAFVGPSVLGNYQEALKRASGLLCATDKELMAEMSL
ncbi:hypothetical protein RHMOL_Rhmol06G0118700 [Rhododendron molle]|uniref:Uncharacterized protein n=1 Tax=Rhododendron molle TaxID=49168 RepID=A0ACC0NBL8_RHOML|nr:hypothetical protein RHMOL_Rhmol06G0118700 [Rhododendron molle]